MVCMLFRAVDLLLQAQPILLAHRKYSWHGVLSSSSLAQHSRTHSYTHTRRDAYLCSISIWILTVFYCLTLFLMCFFLSQTLYRDPLTWRQPICSETGWIRIPQWLHWSPSPRAPRQVRLTDEEPRWSLAGTSHWRRITFSNPFLLLPALSSPISPHPPILSPLPCAYGMCGQLYPPS